MFLATDELETYMAPARFSSVLRPLEKSHVEKTGSHSLHFNSGSLTLDKAVDFLSDHWIDTAEARKPSISNGKPQKRNKSFTKLSDAEQKKEDALNAANEILKNVKEMRKGVESKTIQEKIKQSNNRKPMVENFR